MQNYIYNFYFPNKIQTYFKKSVTNLDFSMVGVDETPLMRSDYTLQSANKIRRIVKHSDNDAHL